MQFFNFISTRISTLLFIILLICSSVITSCKKDDDKKEETPVVPPAAESCFNFTINGGIVTFNSECSVQASSWDWDFGDNNTSIAQNPTHTYQTYGTYTVSLRVTSGAGLTATESKEVVIAKICETCTCSSGGHSATSSLCGTAQQAEEFCQTCREGSTISVICSCN